MKNALYILAVIAIAAAAFLGFQVKGKTETQLAMQEDLLAQNTNLSNTIVERSEERELSTNARDTARSEKDETVAKLQAARSKFGTLKRTLADVDVRLDEARSRNEKYDVFIASLKEQIPGGGDDIRIEDVPTLVNGLREERKQKEASLEELDVVRGRLSKDVVKLTDEANRTATKIDDSKARVAGNKFEARVTSVNNKWGFLVIGAGENSGLTGESKLLVKRGNRHVGKVAISKIEPNLAIAEVVRGSMPEGAVVQAGDRVILEEVRSN